MARDAHWGAPAIQPVAVSGADDAAKGGPSAATDHRGGGVAESYRPARPDEIEEVARLQAHSFPSPNRSHTWWEDFLLNGPHGGLESLWVAEEQGRLVGACQ